MNIVFDIGGTNMRIAVANGEEIGEVRKVPTPKDPNEGILALKQLARELAGGEVRAAAGDIAGRIDAKGRLFDAKNLQQWEGVEIEKEIAQALGTSVRVFNDAVVVGFGEAQKGAGKGFTAVTYITVSTGVGGAKIIADLAHAPILAELTLSMGDLEPLISGTAITKKFGIHPKDLESIDERNKLADILAAGLAEIAASWNPDVFVLGGSMIVGVNPIPLERVREQFSAVPVKMAELGDSGGLVGAAVLANQ